VYGKSLPRKQLRSRRVLGGSGGDVVYRPPIPYPVRNETPPNAEPPGGRAHADFAAAVENVLEGGLLRYSKRLELLKLAKRLGLERFQAALIIAQVQYRKGQLGASRQSEAVDQARRADSGLNNRKSELFLKIAAFMLAAALADLIIVRALFG